jgi:hypothetical protein
VHYTGRTQNNGAVLIVNTIKTAPFFCVCPVNRELYNEFVLFSVFKNVYVFMLRLVARARNDVLRNCALEIARYILDFRRGPALRDNIDNELRTDKRR